LLSIRERIELLGGRMKIKSVKGQGSTFHIAVPDAGPQDDAPEKKTVEAELPAGPTPGAPRESPLRVLLADDHDIVREGLASLLGEEYDIEVVGEAANGREVVDQAYRLRPDVVIMDVVMPLITGDSATRQIKQHLPGTRVIVLSMYDRPETKETMYRAGADGYVLKTAPPEELLAAIRDREPRGSKSR
jgi:CheY-like chemotaxis protein